DMEIDIGNGSLPGMTIGLLQSSPGCVTITLTLAAAVAPWVSVASSVAGNTPARLNVCDALVPVAVNQSSGNVQSAVAESPPSTSLTEPAKLTIDPFVTVTVAVAGVEIDADG